MMHIDAYITPTNDINYKTHRTYLTNHLGSMSHYIMPIIIHSLGADTHTHINIQAFVDGSNYKKLGVCHCSRRIWFKNFCLRGDEENRKIYSCHSSNVRKYVASGTIEACSKVYLHRAWIKTGSSGMRQFHLNNKVVHQYQNLDAGYRDHVQLHFRQQVF